MNSTPNPIMSQGSLNETKPRNKSNVYIAVFAILAFHVVLLGTLLINGCNKADKPAAVTDSVVSNLPPIVYGNPADSNLAVTPSTSLTSMPPISPTVASTLSNEPTPVAPLTPIVVAPPIPVLPPAAATVAVGGEHAIAKGETFAIIAKKYGVSVAAIVKANPGVSSNRLKVNQKIKIPEHAAPAVAGAAPGETLASPTTPPAAAIADRATTTTESTYVVKAGDNLMRVAKAHGTTVNKLKAFNHLKTDRISTGQKLKIPGKAAAAPTPGVESAPTTVPTTSTPPTASNYVTPLPTVPTRSASLR